VNDLTHDLLDADRPISVLRPAARPETPEATQPAVEQPAVASVSDANAEPSLVGTLAGVVVEPEAVPAMAPTTPVPSVDPAGPPADSRAPADRPEQPAVHPLNSLRSFRLEPLLVEPTYSWRRDVGRFLVHYALVMAFVYALIVVFVLLVAHIRGTPA
jgi:hypothetical protein